MLRRSNCARSHSLHYTSQLKEEFIWPREYATVSIAFLASAIAICLFLGVERLWLTESAPTRVETMISDDPRRVSVLFATDRDWKGTNDISFGYGRTANLSFGVAEVRIPDSHSIGGIERPGLIIYGITFWGHADNDRESFQLKAIKRMDRDQFVAAIKSSVSHTALVFVHGFNNTFEDGVFRLAQITFDMQYKGSPILFSWASEGGGALTYDYDRESARFAQGHFLKLLELIWEFGYRAGIRDSA